METVNAMKTAEGASRQSGVLYPMMLIAAIAVILLSAVGIATMMGWMPAALSGGERIANPESAPVAKAGAGSSRPRIASSGPAGCRDCGVIEAIRVVEVKGEGSGLGAIGGAVVGGVLGHQVGSGRGRDAATVVGAGAGAYAGHEIEKNVKKSSRYQVTVRMSDGTFRTFYENAQPAVIVGQKVRVTEHGVVAAG